MAMRRRRIPDLWLIMVAALAAIPLLGCVNSEDPAQAFTMVGEEREVRGMVADAKLTLCAPPPDKAGTCEGTLVVEPEGGGAAGRVTVNITRAVTLQKGGQAVLLLQLRGSQVIVKYRATKEGPSVATSVVAAS
ncbi:MAG: hypothetical protein J0H01_36685 [Rhizobiales bacterium]|nr:hypothetical protein [Hyphomicrobiales bacterium]